MSCASCLEVLPLVGEEDIETRVRLEDLVKKGDMDANIEISPGDVIIIPEAWF